MQNIFSLSVLILWIINFVINFSQGATINNPNIQRRTRQTDAAKCVPPIIPNGNIVVLKQKSSKQVDILSLNITCADNYVLQSSTNFLLNCFNGFWDETDIPQCKRCVKRDYSTVMDDDTDSRLFCPENAFFTECGQRNYGIHHPFIVNGSIAKFAEFPWHVAIYKNDESDSQPVYQCGGSIITEKSVLTVAHCLSDHYGNTVTSREYHVAAGKFHSYYNSDVNTAQKRKGVRISLHPEYKGIKRNYAWDIAVIIVDLPFEISSIVHPVCIDWKTQFENEHFIPGKYGEVAGWGKTEETSDGAAVELRVLKVPYIEREQCNRLVPNTFIKFVTFDKFCAGYMNGSSVCDGDSGGGLVFGKQVSGQIKFYVRGLVSGGSKKDGTCDSFQYSTYTKVSEHLHFIRDIIQNTPLPPSGATSTPDLSYDKAAETTVPCTTPNEEQAKCVSLYDCGIFVDVLQNDPRPDVLRFINDSRCGGLIEKKVCCGSHFNYFSIIRSNPITSKRIEHSNLQLLPKAGVCGLHQEGKVAELLDYPWIVLLEYWTSGDTFDFHCEGSLINERYVLTSAYCAVRKSPSGSFQVNYVRLGDYDTSTEIDCVKGTSFLPNGRNCSDPLLVVNVENVIVHPFYNRALRDNNIALLRLTRNVSYTDFIKPICLPLNGERSRPGKQIIFAGWSNQIEKVSHRSSTGTITGFQVVRSPIKLKTLFYAAPVKECTRKSYKSSILFDFDICVVKEYTRKENECSAGGPLMATLTNSSDLYVEGIVGLQTDSSSPSTATRVADYMDWILDNIKA